MSLRAFLKRIPSEKFIQINRSNVVAISAIESITSDTITIGHKELPLSRNFGKKVFGLLDLEVQIVLINPKK